MRRIKNIREWQVFKLLGIEDAHERKQLRPLIRRDLKNGIEVTQIVKYIGRMRLGDFNQN